MTLMPTYEYQCAACGKAFEVAVSLAEYMKGVRPACPRCGAGKAVRTFTSVNVKTRSKTGRGWG